MLYSFQQGLLNMPPKRDPDRRLLLLPTEEIRPNPHPSRKRFDRTSISELMVSIAQVGLIQPITVRELSDGYELIAGERRLKACRLLGYREVPCIVVRASDEKSAAMTLVENTQWQRRSFMEEAEGLEAFQKAFGCTEERLAIRIGKSQAYLSNKLRLLELSPDVRMRLRALGLSERHARALLRLDNDEQRLQALDMIERKRLSAAAAERLTDAMAKTAPIRQMRCSKDARLFVNSVKTCIEQLDGTGMTATLEETRREDGLDLIIHVKT
jgi:ParB family chromosome partitioning protein